MSRVLIVEDEAHIAEGLRFNIEADGHQALVVGDGAQALATLLRDRDAYDAVILDVMLPGRNGFQVAAELRKAGQLVPILMLTARGRPEDVLRGFESGADDYLPKPFELAILLARLRGLLRRRAWMREAAERAVATRGGAPPAAESAPTGEGSDLRGVATFAGKRIDFDAMELSVGDTRYHLTLMECGLLRYLLKNRGRAVSRKEILEQVWGLHEDTDTRAIDNFIVRLRRYIEADPSSPKHLVTVRGVGYKFIPEPE